MNKELIDNLYDKLEEIKYFKKLQERQFDGLFVPKIVLRHEELSKIYPPKTELDYEN